MDKKVVRQFISFVLAVSQFLTWAQQSFAIAMPVGGFNRAGFESAKSSVLNGMPNVPSRFGKTPIAKAVDDLRAEFGRVTPNGAFQANVVRNGEEVIGQVGLAAPTKINAITMLKKAANTKTGKFVLNFPAEALLFFTALGAISKMQLWNDFSDNPVSWEQHVMAHDPTTADGQIGYVAIAAFMAFSRGTEAALYNLIGDTPRGKYFIPLVPYAGMSIGLLASTLVHEAHNFPQLKKCTMALEKRIQEEEKWEDCERAYDSFSELGYEKLQGLMPTLFAMVTSTVMAGFVESMTLRKVLTMVGWQVLFEHRKEVLKEVLLGFSGPARLGIHGARFLYRVTQFVGQTAVQMWQEPAITTWWKNFSDGSDLSKLEIDIMNQLDRKKRIGWNQPTPRTFGDLDLSLAKLSQYSMDWRKGNLHYTILRHQNWIQYLTHFSTMYTASMKFYNYYINEYRNRYINRVPSKLDDVYPFSGIEPLIPEDPNNPGTPIGTPSELTNKEDYQNMQIQRMIEAREYQEKQISEHEADFNKAFPKAMPEFKKLLAMLPTGEEYQKNTLRYADMSNAINTINGKLGIKFDSGVPFYLMSTNDLKANIESLEKKVQEISADTSLDQAKKEEKIAEIKSKMIKAVNEKNNNSSVEFDDERELYSELRKSIGNPLPITLEGYGFLKAYQEKADEEGLGLIRYPKTELLTDKQNNSGINGIYSTVNTALQFLRLADEHGTPFTSKSNTIVYHHPSQYMAAQIAFGPRADLKESLVAVNRRGFPVQFNPPRLVDSFSYNILLDETTKVSADSKSTIFNTPVVVTGAKGAQTRYKNIFDITRSQNILPGIIHHKDGFMGWWKENAEAQYALAWSKFEDEYQRIMVEIYEQYKYYRPAVTLDNYWPVFRKSGFSSGAPLSNGLQLSFRQERRLYLMILGEMLKDHSEQIGKTNPLFTLGKENQKIEANKYPLKPFLTMQGTDKDLVNFNCDNLETAEKDVCIKNRKEITEYQRSLRIPLVEVLRGNSKHLWPIYATPFIPILDHLKSTENYSYSQILRSYNSKDVIPTKEAFAANHFKFQDDIELIFQNLEYYLEQIKIQEVATGNVTIGNQIGGGAETFETTKKILTSTITNQQLRDAQNRIDKVLEEKETEIKTLFENVNPKILPIILASFRGLRSVAEQTAELGRMINAVSYEKSDEKDPQKSNNICDKNSFVASKIGPRGAMTNYIRKACKPNKYSSPLHQLAPAGPVDATPVAAEESGS